VHNLVNILRQNKYFLCANYVCILVRPSCIQECRALNDGLCGEYQKIPSTGIQKKSWLYCRLLRWQPAVGLPLTMPVFEEILRAAEDIGAQQGSRWQLTSTLYRPIVRGKWWCPFSQELSLKSMQSGASCPTKAGGLFGRRDSELIVSMKLIAISD
jgi:hypothetical protein